MKAYSSNTNAERTGERLGYAWRAFIRKDHRITQGASPFTASAFLWIMKLAALAALPLAAIAAAIARRGDQQPPQDWFPKPTDHRDEPFYDPLSYNDDPDPRFEDD